MKVNYLIVGQGLAGSLIAWHLLKRNQRVLVVDQDEAVTSSKVAAGLVTPLAGSRFSIPEGLSERLDYAHQFYWEMEEKLKKPFFHHTRITRIFRNEKEQQAWKKRQNNKDEAFDRLCGPATIDPDRYSAPFGGFEMKHGGWMSLPSFLEATRQHLLERTAYAIASLKSDDVKISPEGIQWKNIEADGIIFAQGWRGSENRFFDWLPMKSAAGDILDLSIPELKDESRIINSGGWLLPVGDGRFRAGSTYRHDFSDMSPSAQGRNEVLEKLAGFTQAKIEVKGHRSAIRPIIQRSQAFIGRHPSEPRVAFFNGLGSKGVINGPWHAERLAAHLLEDVGIPEKCDIRSNFE